MGLICIDISYINLKEQRSVEKEEIYMRKDAKTKLEIFVEDAKLPLVAK